MREDIFGALKILFYFKDVLIISEYNHVLSDVTRKSSRFTYNSKLHPL